jgi:hypothetical protein
MATTPNYGWVTPAPTDFVTDLPADFETFADAVDADLAGLLGGTTGQVLIKDSATDHDFSWGTPATGGYTLLATATGTGSSNTITFSSISSSYKHLFVFMEGPYGTSTSAAIQIRFNSDTGNNYNFRFQGNTSTADAATNRVLYQTSATFGSNTDRGAADLWIYDYTKTTSPKVGTGTGFRQSTVGGDMRTGGFSWDNASALDAIEFQILTGNFATETKIYLYGVS